MRSTVAVCFLLVFSFSSLTRGDHDSNLPMVSAILSPSENSSPLIHNSTADLNSITNSTDSQLNTSSEVNRSTAADLPHNGTLIQGSNATTEAPDYTTANDGTTMATTTVNGTSVPGNSTESQGGSDLSVEDNHTLSTMTASISSTLPSIQLPKTKPQTLTSAPTTQTLMLSTLTKPQSTTVIHKTATTSSKATTAQSKQKSSTSVTTVPTTTSTPVQAKARADTLSELNVGDDDLKASMDPLLAGLVSVFVVTAVIISLLIFLKFRRRNERPEFRRLQDLPMDDMMEDTPLSMYSY